MAEINWGLLNTNAPAQIAGSFMQGMDAETARQAAEVERQYLAKKRLMEEAAAEKAIADEQRRRAFLATIPERMRAQVVPSQTTPLSSNLQTLPAQRAGQSTQDPLGFQTLIPTGQRDLKFQGGQSEPALTADQQALKQQLLYEGLGQEMLAVPGLEQTGFSMLTEAQKEKARLAALTEQAREKAAEAARARQEKAAESALARQDRAALMTTLAGMRPQPMDLKVVQDGTSPTGWSYVDARSKQMIPGAPPPAAQAKTEGVEKKAVQGRESLQNTLAELKAKYDRLNQLEAIPSTARSGVSNLLSATQTSDAGQFLGGATGTEAQKLRDEIKSARLLLLQDIKNATGMTASQMNSNVELQNWLNAVTDPKRIYETNLGIIKNLGNKYGSVSQPSGVVVSVQSEQEALSLPAGTRFKLPDGRTGTAR